MLRDGGVVGAEELLNLEACQAAVPASLSQPRRDLREQQHAAGHWVRVAAGTCTLLQ